jgi:hypothetical protein
MGGDVKMVLPVSLNPCEDLNSEVDELVHSFEQEVTYLRSQVENFRQTLTDFADVPSTQEAIAAAVGAAGTDDVDAGLTGITQIRNFTGSCLDSVFNSAKKYSAIIDHAITDKIDDITSFVALPEVNLLTPLRALRAAMGDSAISELLNTIDEKLGCLADGGSEISECLDLYTNFNDRIDDALSYLGMGDQAADLTKDFNLDNFVDAFNIPIDADALTNLNSLDTKMNSIASEASANVRAVLKQQKPPQEWF